MKCVEYGLSIEWVTFAYAKINTKVVPYVGQSFPNKEIQSGEIINIIYQSECYATMCKMNSDYECTIYSDNGTGAYTKQQMYTKHKISANTLKPYTDITLLTLHFLYRELKNRLVLHHKCSAMEVTLHKYLQRLLIGDHSET